MYCLRVNVYCHRVSTQLQLTNISVSIDKTMTLLKPLSNTSLLILYEQYYIHSLHKERKLISEQSPGDPNPLLLLAIDPPNP
jgi:hypothetical protein